MKSIDRRDIALFGWLGGLSLLSILGNGLALEPMVSPSCTNHNYMLWLVATFLTGVNLGVLAKEKGGMRWARVAMMIQVATWLAPLASMGAVHFARELGYTDRVRIQQSDGSRKVMWKMSIYPHMR